ncbi:histone acetyltransferase type B catalytic subunit-like isoform X2 [Liolophura sinensis]|uniref:histone acetyltransferase type B catalytic subunit-like isoform X2 n=1 Tax=Liolophura sinensis TaxID=3198878 RepID=UPI00315893D4
MGGSIIKNELEAYKCCANEAIEFKLVRQESDIEDENTSFKPDMTHQLFGNNESIFGFKDLKVQMFYSAAKLETYIMLKYSEKVSPDTTDGVMPDDVVKVLASKMPSDFTSNLDDFLSKLPKEANFKPHGQLLHSYDITKGGENRVFEIYKAEISTPGFLEYHERLQTFVLFYIDAASYIDVDDDRWKFYVLYEKYLTNGNPMYAVAGYMTVYEYYAYPAKIRPRISQVLILPPFQRQSHGAELIQTFYNECYQRKEVLDITVEDPSENFQRLRDFVDVKNCLKLQSFQKESVQRGFCDGMAKEAQEKLKLTKRQARRVYEILRLKATDTSNKEEYKKYRLDVKKRLNAPFQKNGRDFQKLNNALQPDELTATVNSLTREQRLGYLENTFNDHIDMYRHVLERIAATSI